MKNSMTRFLICALPLVLISPALANVVNVTNTAEVTLGNNDSLLFYITDPGASPCRPTYPSEIEMVIGSLPLGGPVESIPGTSGGYVQGWLFSATLVSADGSVSIPLSDPDATRLGLPAGTLLLTPGSVSGGSYSGPIDLVSADVSLTPHQAAALFGSGEAMIELTNIGDGVTFGYPGTEISNDFSASLLSDNGAQSEGARVMQVDCRKASTTPEPGTVGLLLIGLAVIGARWRRVSGNGTGSRRGRLHRICAKNIPSCFSPQR